MGGNIIAFLTILILGAVAFWFGLQSAKLSSINKQWLVLLIWMLSLFLILNTIFAINGWRSLRALTTTPVLTSASDWNRTSANQGLILEGTVSRENEILRAENIVAYFECGEPCYLFHSPPLRIELRGGNVGISNRDFQEREWAYERGLNYSYYNLEVNDPVVVIGQRVSDQVQAELVFRGSYENFLAHTQRKMTQAMVIIGLNAIATAAFIGTGFAYWDPKDNPLKELLLS